jgi:hypothetical protein
MTIILFLGKSVKEYKVSGTKIAKQHIDEGNIICEICLKAMSYHSSYWRGAKETGQRFKIIMACCKGCNNFHALLPDFLLPHKHYSGTEIEGVILDSEIMPVNQIETQASQATINRWVNKIGEKVGQAIGILKYLFKEAGQAVSEAAIEPGLAYSELQQVLERAPADVRFSNNFGLANIWLSTSKVAMYI